MKKENWVIDAIEKEALSRAAQSLLMGDGFRFMGLDQYQIMKCIKYYQEFHDGKYPEHQSTEISDKL